MILLSGFFLFSFSTFADNINLKENNEISLKIKENTYSKLSLSNKISEIKTLELNTTEGIFTKLYISGYTKNIDFGNPLLPVKRKLIEIPVGANPVIKINSFTVNEYSLTDLNITNKLFPAQPPQSKSIDEHEFIINQKAYQNNSFGNKRLISVEVLGYMRGTRIARVDISPVQYNPVTNIIRVYENIDFEVIFENADITATIEMKEKYASPYFKLVNHQLFNYKEPNTRENFMRYPVKYVIVSDTMFEDQLQPFIEWKTKKGFTVIEAYTDNPNVGSTTTSIKAYLEGLYDAGTPEDPAPSFILFVGDVQQIPVWNNGNGVTDRNYCEYTGDLFPEIYYGRFSAQTTAQLQPQIDKTLQYEQYLMPDPSYLEEVVMIAGMDSGHGNDWGNGQINYGTINYFNADHNILSHTYLYPESGSNSANIIQNISDGVTFGNYTAHCSPSGWGNPSFTTSDIPGLQNQDKYGLLIGNCCSSSEYQQSECFGEAIVRAENKGAVGYIGGSNSTYWDEDYYFGVGVGAITENPPPYEETTLGNYDRSFHDHGEDFGEWYVSQDEIIYAGNLAVTEGTPSSAAYYWDIYNILGDPSLMIYYSVPPVLSVSYDPLMPLGSTSFTINTEAYAYAAISKDGVLYGAALADATGTAVVQLTPISVPGTADVIVTKQNAQPYIGTVTVDSPAGPYVLLDEYILNDSLGNDNGIADYGEDITFDITLENVGNSDAINATATLSTEDTNVIITDDFQEWGNIASQSTSLQEDAFGVTVADFVPDQHIVNFDMLIEDDSKEIWNSGFSIILNSPVLNAGTITIDDSQGGNGDGRLDEGETADIIISTSNSGHSDAFGTISTLTSTSTDITINSATYNIDTLLIGNTKEAIFNITVNAIVPIGTPIELNYLAEAGPYSVEKQFVTVIGLLFEDFETGTFDNFGWTFGGNADWFICTVDPYEGLNCAQSGVISDLQTSELYTIVQVSSDDSLSFYKKVSCEDDTWNDNYDFLAFFIDDVEMGRWDGEIDWSREVYAVTAGEHEFKWVYSKDYSVSSGSDCAWVDYIVFPPISDYVTVENITDKNSDFNIYPNPITNSANIILTLEKNASVNIEVYNAVGQKVLDIVNNPEMKSGIHNFTLDAASLQEGLYFCILNSENIKTTKKLIIVKL
ncbi:MAG: T9SS type A sorting domain-containing protein [Bacteroidales bacterium]|nr:T9SS type A sorting domain-containing protein [Bacteroidales bacterium]